MVTVKDYKKRENKEGKNFYVLILQGGVFPVRSQETGRMYFTAKTCSVSTTFDEETCMDLIGSQFPGTIERVETEPYNYTVPESGDVIELSHRWEYQDNINEKITEPVIPEAEII